MSDRFIQLNWFFIGSLWLLEYCSIKASDDQGISLHFFCMSKKKTACSKDPLEFLISRTRRWLLQLNIEQLCNLEKYNTYLKNTYDVRANIINQKVPCIKYLRSIAFKVACVYQMSTKQLRRWRSLLERSPRKRKVECSNSSSYRPNSYKTGTFILTAPLLNAPQLVWLSRFLGDDHYKRMSRVTVGVGRETSSLLNGHDCLA